MKRREFIIKSIGAGAVVGSALTFSKYFDLLGGNNFPQGDPFDLVAIRGGEAYEMFETGINSLGGMKNFVSPGQTVVVKPNIGWDAIPERAANTNPKLIGQIIKSCLEAGAKEVYVFDNTCDKWNKCYKNSGIEKAAKDAGAKVVPGNIESKYRTVEIPGAEKLKNPKVHELILDSDVFINVPVLKSHGSTKLTISMKNLMGIVWDRKFWHKNDLNQCIADFASKIKPDLNIVDASKVMKQNGPRGVSVEDVVELKSMIISTDMVAADAAAAKIFGHEPEDIGHIQIAHNIGAGNMDLTKLNIDRIKM
jgi:uncharacterized protein (DUF362 family)